jgi:hypothetical protein
MGPGTVSFLHSTEIVGKKLIEGILGQTEGNNIDRGRKRKRTKKRLRRTA